MLVRFRRDYYHHLAGNVEDLEDVYAYRLIANRIAERVEEQPKDDLKRKIARGITKTLGTSKPRFANAN